MRVMGGIAGIRCATPGPEAECPPLIHVMYMMSAHRGAEERGVMARGPLGIGVPTCRLHRAEAAPPLQPLSPPI
jgi:hypothetical protein